MNTKGCDIVWSIQRSPILDFKCFASSFCNEVIRRESKQEVYDKKCLGALFILYES